ncbi:hypothetical protein ASE01_20330 [Nocardioides sp. Root190]|uniref:flagellar basal body-associated FliL family protein n=1 Tax=Nocardioides sp. Root190 TaxID=1736488 RepID=UPI0007009007|nr:flagellar basal body-associated FliL family protein [Nocardioides sp. Root190]KRB73122.1 hypothetical protein ASE01_20330 [Nocardioides sp. Root190]
MSQAAATKDSEPPTKSTRVEKGKSKWLVVFGAVALGATGLTLQAGSDSVPEPGEVMVLDPVQLNLAAGRYLRIGLALQLAEGVKEVDGSRALDAAITTFSGLPLSAVDGAEERDKLKADLTSVLTKMYPAEVLDSYFVEFVTQ